MMSLPNRTEIKSVYGQKKGDVKQNDEAQAVVKEGRGREKRGCEVRRQFGSPCSRLAATK